jgi:hypothetical protein
MGSLVCEGDVILEISLAKKTELIESFYPEPLKAGIYQG